MLQQLTNHICRFINVTSEQIADILSRFDTGNYETGTHLVREGTPCNHIFFVLSGSLRLFFQDNDLREKTIHFAIEDWWITEINAFNRGVPAEFSIQTLEKTVVASIEKSALEQLIQDHPLMAVYFNHIYQRAYAASLMKIKTTSKLSKEEFHRYFTTHYSAFVQKLPKQVLASYIGISEEYLEELNRRIFS